MIATDGIATYVLFLYGDIQWGGAGRTVTIGFNAGDGMRFFNLPEASSSIALQNLPFSSNVGMPGTYIFRVDQDPTLCSNETSKCTQECLFNITTSMVVCSCRNGYEINSDGFTCDGECLNSCMHDPKFIDQ